MDCIKYINGIKVLQMDSHSDMSFVGINLLAGANYENEEEYGIAHFSEHMFFKGTSSRNYKEISLEMAKIGGQLNAYTSNSNILLKATAPGKNIKKTAEILTDMLFNSTFEESEIEKERKVILEEIQMNIDEPYYWFFSKIGDELFVPSIGHNILGTKENVSKFTPDDIRKYLDRVINKNNIMYVFVGKHKSEEIDDIVRSINIPLDHRYLKEGEQNIYNGKTWSDKKELILQRDNMLQTHACLNLKGLSALDNLYVDYKILINALGGGSYSYLFDIIREQLGLCYHVGAFNVGMELPHINILGIYSSTSPENKDLLLEKTDELLDKVVKEGLDVEIFDAAKNNYLSDVLSTTDRSEGIGNRGIRLNSRRNNIICEDIVERINKSDFKTCNMLAEKLLSQEKRWSVMNPSEK